MFIDKPLCHKQAPSERHVVLCFICRSDGAKVLYITFFYKHFTPTGLFFKELKCYADSNLKKHGIDFADAVGVFEDEWALTIKEHYVGNEQRFVTIGMDFLGRTLVVVYTYRNHDIRLISARTATKREREIYERKRI